MGVVRESLLGAVAGRARDAGVFADVTIDGDRLVCTALDAAEPAEYRLEWADGRLWAALVTPNRWLSESIETDLLHTGDKIEELLEDELVDLGYEEGPLRVEHFRSEDMLFTFRSPIPLEGCGEEAAALRAAACLLAYEACFRQLGDMDGGDEE